jgi:hypothetical protein
MLVSTNEVTYSGAGEEKRRDGLIRSSFAREI